MRPNKKEFFFLVMALEAWGPMLMAACPNGNSWVWASWPHTTGPQIETGTEQSRGGVGRVGVG